MWRWRGPKMPSDRGAVPRFVVPNLVAAVWVSCLFAEYGDSQLPSCKVGPSQRGSSWHGTSGPLGLLVSLVGCQLGGTAGLLALGGAVHVINTYLAMMLAATALAHLCPGRTTEDLSTREWRSCALAALPFGCHRAAGALLNPENQFSRQHGTGVLLGTMLALCALTARLEAHWRWDNAYSAVSPLASLAHIHPRAPVPLCRHHGSQRLRNACCGIYCCCYVG